jgi:hypothetical protein
VDIASSYVDEGGEPREFPYMVAWRDGTMVVFDRAGDQKPAHGAVRVCEAVPAVSIERKEALADDVLPKVHAGDKISISLYAMSRIECASDEGDLRNSRLC